MRSATRLAAAAPVLGLLLALTACRTTQGVIAQGSVFVQEFRITTTSDEARTHYAVGERLLDAGRPQEANALFRKAVELDSGFAYAYLGIANSAASTQEFKEAVDAAGRHIEGKSEGERLLLEINRTFLANNAAGALDLAQKLTQTYPNTPRAWLVLGNAQGALNQTAAARESFRRALAIDKNMYAARVALGFSYLFGAPRDLVQAKEQMAAAIASAPDEAKGYEFLGDVHRAMNQLESARSSYARALEKDSTLGVARLKMGHINSFLGNYAEARTNYDAAIAGARDGAKVGYANFRALTHVHAGDPRGALDELAEVERSAGRLGIPEHQVGGARIGTLSLAAQIALHHGLTDAAASIIDRLAAVTREDAARVADTSYTRQQEATLLAWQSQLAARRGDFAAAASKAEAHKRLVEGDRNPRKLETYHALLGLIELRKGNNQAAVEHYRQSDLTTDVYNRYHLALALEAIGQVSAARHLFQEVGAYNFNSIGFALARADARKRGGGKAG